MFVSKKEWEEKMKELAKTRTENEELRSELSDLRCKYEALLSCDKCQTEEIKTVPLAVAEHLINAHYMRKPGRMASMFFGSEDFKDPCFSIANLREIANHLIVYCDAVDDERYK